MGMPNALLSIVLLTGVACGHQELEPLDGGRLGVLARRIDRARDGAAPAFAADSDGDLASVPEGYLLVTPLARSGDFGHAVLLLEPESEKIVPIFIGGTEALSIQLRLAGETFSRPLTHDLFDSFRSRLGVTMVRAQVDALRDSVYVGTVVFSRGGPRGEVSPGPPGQRPEGQTPPAQTPPAQAEYIRLDARPSDAIALAIGNKAPIFISRALLDEAGVRREDLGKPEPKGNPVEL